MVGKFYRLVLSLGLIGIAGQVWAAAPFKGVLTNSTSTVKLEFGWYMVTNDVTITSTEVGKPGIDCMIGMQFLYLRDGVTLTVKGCNGFENQPGTAAIRLGALQTLVVVGNGTIVAQGGNAADGGDGESGGDATINVSAKTCKPGYGGAGGCGGGGAGAGIGTDGTAGAESLGRIEPPECEFLKSCAGSNSLEVSDGEYVEDNLMGHFLYLGNLKLKVTGGAAGAGGKAGVAIGSSKECMQVVGSGSAVSNLYFEVGGGGSGGGGGGGSAAFPIGSGGVGGNAGLSGASGGATVEIVSGTYTWQFHSVGIQGWGGLGGVSPNGKKHTDYPTFGPGGDGAEYSPSVFNNSLQNGGRRVERGGSAAYVPYIRFNGWVFRVGEDAPVADVSGIEESLRPTLRVDSPLAGLTDFTITYADPNGVLKALPANKPAVLEQALTDSATATSKVFTVAFDGWQDADGRKIFDRRGKPVISKYDMPYDVTLYPIIVNPTEIPTEIFVNGEEIDKTTGKVSGDGWIYEDYVLKFTEEGKEYSLCGTNDYGVVSIDIQKSCKVILDGVGLCATTNIVPGIISINPGASVDLVINKKSYLLADSVINECGIHCPTGAAVTISSTIERALTMEQSLGGKIVLNVDTNEMFATEAPLEVSGGSMSAAIGSHGGEPSGAITIDNCHVDIHTGALAYAIGHGWSLAAKDEVLCDEIILKGMPRLYKSAGTTNAPVVLPNPHNEYGRPLHWAGVNGEFYFLPAGLLEMHYQDSNGNNRVFKGLIRHTDSAMISDVLEK